MVKLSRRGDVLRLCERLRPFEVLCEAAAVNRGSLTRLLDDFLLRIVNDDVTATVGFSFISKYLLKVP